MMEQMLNDGSFIFQGIFHQAIGIRPNYDSLKTLKIDVFDTKAIYTQNIPKFGFWLRFYPCFLPARKNRLYPIEHFFRATASPGKN